MNISKIKLVDLIWVGYPILAIFFIIFSINYLMGSGENSLQGVMAKKDDSEVEQKAVMDLRTKLDKLKKIDKNVETEKLKKLLAAAPVAKRVWYLLRAVNRSASEAGVIVKEFSGSVGDVKEASQSATSSAVPEINPYNADALTLRVDYELMTVENLNKVIAGLESYMPLIKIVKVDFMLSKTTLTLEGAWGKLLKTPKIISLELPEYDVVSKKAIDDISNLIDLTVIVEPSASESAVVNQ